MTAATTRSRWAQLELRILKEEQVPTETSIITLLQGTGMHRSPQETMWVIAYDSQLYMRTMIEIGRGDHNRVTVHLPTLIAAVVTVGAERFQIAHNHSTGVAAPTQADLAATKWMNEATRAAGLYLEDHLILTPQGGYYSFAGAGLLTQDYQTTQQGSPVAAGLGRSRQ